MLDFVLQFKVKPEKLKNKFFDYSLYLLAHKGSGFDNYDILDNLSLWRTVVMLIKNGSGIVSLEIFNRYVDPVKKYLNVFILMRFFA